MRGAVRSFRKIASLQVYVDVRRANYEDANVCGQVQHQAIISISKINIQNPLKQFFFDRAE
jgi:hypothetical protein